MYKQFIKEVEHQQPVPEDVGMPPLQPSKVPDAILRRRKTGKQLGIIAVDAGDPFGTLLETRRRRE